MLWVSSTQLTGTGTINTSGLVGDVDLVFDSTHGPNQTFTINQPGKNITLNLTLNSNQTLGAGYRESGSLTIRDGVVVTSRDGYIGCRSGSSGTVTVDGKSSNWTSATNLYVGGGESSVYSYMPPNGGNGTLSITNGGSVTSSRGYIGCSTGSNGVATVSGSNSKWNISSDLYVGKSGNGTLNIADGGIVSATGVTYVGYDTGVTGSSINFGTGGGTLTTGSLWASTAQLTGTGTINTTGLVSDVDLVFDASHGLKQTLTVNPSGQNITVNLDMPNAPSTNIDLGVGYHGSGSIAIRDGIAINSRSGYLGYHSGSSGVATVGGSGSKWTNSASLYVGFLGDGTMRIADGGAVSNTNAYIGNNSGSASMVTVDGIDSTWTNSSALYVGSRVGGRGTLMITGGGSVTATTVSSSGESLLAIDVGRGSSLAIDGGNGIMNYGGIVRIFAGAGVSTDATASPISARTWYGGTYQALGGTWNATDHTFTASAVKAGASGTAVTINLADAQRALITDSKTRRAAGASFLASEAPSSFNFTATAVTGDALNLLESKLGADDAVLSAWNFLADGYTVSETNPVYLSLKIGSGRSADELALWHYDGSAWTAYSPMDLTYDGTYASFTVTSFSGYAMSGLAVPEPSAIALLFAATVGLTGYARSRRARTR
jgi:T5SS/PEP-CTERM-associated repeat protein